MCIRNTFSLFPPADKKNSICLDVFATAIQWSGISGVFGQQLMHWGEAFPLNGQAEVKIIGTQQVRNVQQGSHEIQNTGISFEHSAHYTIAKPSSYSPAKTVSAEEDKLWCKGHCSWQCHFATLGLQDRLSYSVYMFRTLKGRWCSFNFPTQVVE